MKKILIFILSIIFTSCQKELITVVDEYNSIYDIVAIPTNNGVIISFWSGIIASDFAGFNIYANTIPTFSQPTDAIKNMSNAYPTILGSNHVRSNFVIQIPNFTFNNNTLYYVTATAYGTNDLIENRYIETKIYNDNIAKVIPRPEGIGSGNNLVVNGITVATIANGLIRSSNNWKIQSLGNQTNFNSIVILTNYEDNSFDSEVVYSINGLYILKNSNSLAKIWIISEGQYRWAYQNNASQWWGI